MSPCSSSSPACPGRFAFVAAALFSALLAGAAGAQPTTGNADARGKNAGAAAVSGKPKPPPGGPAWTELTAAQQHALAPLMSSWTGMSEGHKRKWIALSTNYGAMKPAEQAKLHERMTEWAALSPQQRAQARLNFAQTQELSSDEKRAKWEAYQALPAEERRKLGAQGRQQPPGAAPATRPVAPQKLVTVPPPKGDTRHPPRIVTGTETSAGRGSPVAPGQ